MKTLKELFDEHGSVWLSYKNNVTDKLFRPVGYNEELNRIIGEHNIYSTDSFPCNYPNLALYQEPKKKVVRYLFAVRTTQDGWTVRPYFITDNEAVRIYSKTDIVDFKRLDYTATEFEE